MWVSQGQVGSCQEARHRSMALSPGLQKGRWGQVAEGLLPGQLPGHQ